MKRAWSTVTKVWKPFANIHLGLLVSKFPSHKFKFGRDQDFYGEPIIPILALVPYPHPNEETALICKYADSLPLE